MSCSYKLITISCQWQYLLPGSLQVSLSQKKDTFFLCGKRIKDFQSPHQIPQKSVEVSPEWANNLLEKLRNANISPMPEEMIGFDGAFYSMRIGSKYGGAKYTWWSVPPNGWEVLSDVAQQIIDEFSRLLPD